MGIHDLLPFLRKRAASAFVPVGTNLERFAGQRAAVDVAIQMYRAINVLRTDSTVALTDWFLRAHASLLRVGITPTYVFDGEKLDAKANEGAKRALAHARACKKADAARQAYAAALVASEAQDAAVIHAFQMEHDQSATATTATTATTLSEHNFVDIDAAAHALRIAETHTLKPGVPHFAAVAHALTAVGAQCLWAPTEAEKHCAALSQRGDVDLVITNDSDALPFGARRVLFFFGSSKAELCDLAFVLQNLALTLDEFRHLCVLSGCDFCDRVPGIGPGKAYPLILKHHTIAAIIAADARFQIPCGAGLDLSLAQSATEAAISDTRDELIENMQNNSSDDRQVALERQLDALLTRRAHGEYLKAVREFHTRYNTALEIFSRPDNNANSNAETNAETNADATEKETKT